MEAEIQNPDLSAKLLCARLGLSRTSLFEAVAAEGKTLVAMVLDRRLAGCIDDMWRAGGRNAGGDLGPMGLPRPVDVQPRLQAPLLRGADALEE